MSAETETGNVAVLDAATAIGEAVRGWGDVEFAVVRSGGGFFVIKRREAELLAHDDATRALGEILAAVRWPIARTQITLRRPLLPQTGIRFHLHDDRDRVVGVDIYGNPLSVIHFDRSRGDAHHQLMAAMCPAGPRQLFKPKK